jgi:hypothetical protein
MCSDDFIYKNKANLRQSDGSIKDYLENEGYDAVKNGKHAIRVAFQNEIITDAENWMEALKKRHSFFYGLIRSQNFLNFLQLFV